MVAPVAVGIDYSPRSEPFGIRDLLSWMVLLGPVLTLSAFTIWRRRRRA
jgi:hypothetical protein